MKILDCTLRDGGYVNNWRFSDKFVEEYIQLTTKDPIIDYVEIGFMNIDHQNYKEQATGIYRYLNQSQIKPFKNRLGSVKLTVMIDLSSLDWNKLIQTSEIDLIRLAFHKKDYQEAIQVCQKLKEMGFTVSANAMATINYTSTELVDLVQKLKQIRVDYFYIADSYGSLYPDQITSLVQIVKQHSDKMKIGLHLHNNLQNAILNYQVAKNLPIDVIDGTLYGMGRGAGNLPTELILTYEKINPHVLETVILFIQRNIKPIYQVTYNKWGYDLDYLYSAYLNCHPNYVSKMRDWSLELEIVISTLNKIYRDEKHKSFDINYLNSIFLL